MADGDILVAVTYREGGAWTLPSGWAWWGSEQASNAGSSWVGMAWKRASSEGASYTFQLSASAWRIVTVGAWSGCLESGDPADVYAPYTATGTAVKAGSLTTTVADTMLVVGAGCISGNDVGVASSGYTQRAQLGGCELFEKAQATTTTTGVVIFGDAGGLSGEWATQHVALKPATGGNPGDGVADLAWAALTLDATGEVTGAGIIEVQFVAVATNSATAATTSCVLNKPTGAAAGDLLVAALNIEVNAPTVTPPSGWSLIYSATPTGTARAIRQLTYYKLLTSADDGTSNFTWTVTTGYEWAGICAAYRNAKVPTVSASSTTNSSAAAAVAPTITTPADYCWAVLVASSAYGTTWTPPGTYVERADVRSGSGTTNVSIALADQSYPTAGATGTQTYTAANADYWTAGHIALETVGGTGGAADIAWDALTITADGTSGGTSEATGAADLAWSALALTGAGTVDIAGAADLTWGALSLTAAGGVEVQGAADITLGTLALVADGAIGAAPAVGDADLVWSALPITSAGTVDVAGAGVTALDALSIGAAGTVDIAGAATITLGALTIASAGTVGSAAPNNWNISVGSGFTDVSPKQLVRTSGNVLYTIANTCDSYPDFSANGLTQTIRVHKANSTGVPTGFTRKDSAGEPAAATVVAAALDSSDNIRVVWTARSSSSLVRYLRYAVFNTTTDTWGSVTTIASDLDYDDIGQGDQSVALALDAADVCHVVYLGTAGSGTLTSRRVYYRNNAGGSWSSATQVDSGVTYSGSQKAWHPNIVVDASDRRWVTWERGAFNGDGDGTMYSRVYAGSWGSTVNSNAGGEAIIVGIDQSTSQLITPDGVWHITYVLNSGTNSQKYIRYRYSSDQGATWTSNNPSNQATHNPSLGFTGSKVRIYAHGTPDGSNHGDNLYYMESDGGAGSWGTWTQIVTSTHYDCSVNTRWALFNFYYPSTQDIAYWDDAYPNNLYVGTWVLAEDRIAAAAIVWDALTLSAAGTVGSTEIVGAADLVFDALMVTAAGTVEVAGVADLVWAAQAITSAGTVEIAGAAELAFGSLAISGQGAVDVVGAADIALGALTLSAAGVIGAAPAIGDADVVWAALTLDAAGVVEIAGAAALAIDALAVNGAATVDVAGAAMLAWDALAIGAAGVTGYTPVTGDAVLNWGDLVLSAAGGVEVAGAADLVWEPFAPASAGGIGVAGAASLIWGDLVLDTQGSVAVTGTASLLWDSLPLAGSIYIGPMIIAVVTSIIHGGGGRGSVQSGSKGRVHTSSGHGEVHG